LNSTDQKTKYWTARNRCTFKVNFSPQLD